MHIQYFFCMYIADEPSWSSSKKSSYSTTFSFENFLLGFSSFDELDDLPSSLLFSTFVRLCIKIKIQNHKSLPSDIFDDGFLFGSSSKLIRLSPSLISSQRSTGNLNDKLKKTLFIQRSIVYMTLSLLYLTST